ncbi:MAG: glutamyl-tRNA reductase [Deltaproteobacteria bacterium]|nr:glutamyl-tRNA reductase [Deltaproteobacteria bacterium]
MDLVVAGMNHRTAPLDTREKLSCVPGEERALTKEMIEAAGAAECVVVSTCNRFEAYVAAADPASAAKNLERHLCARAGLSPAEGAAQVYAKRGVDAVRHLFRVASSLDSMVVGEAQILGQLKEAYTRASEYHTNGKTVDRVFHAAFRAAKRVRTETSIAENPVSISHVAVDLAESIFSSLRGRNVLVVGAGKMGELAARRFATKGGMKLVVTNRTAEKAAETAARLGAQSAPFDRLESLLCDADVVISSTAAKGYVVTASMLQGVIRRRHYRPLFLVDIAVPRDIEPAAGRIENVYLYDVDDLQKVADSNLGARSAEIARCEAVVGEEVGAFVRRAQEIEAAPLIVALRDTVSRIAAAEVEKALAGLPGADEKSRDALRALAHGIVNKVLHRPTVAIKEEYGADGTAGPELAEAVEKLFGLSDEQKR